MKAVEPQVFLVARTRPDYEAFEQYLAFIGAFDPDVEEIPFGQDGDSAEDLVEFGGRLCYRSWKPGMNPNVTKVRTDQAAYLGNILKQRHGSVIEHASYSFVFHDVSRVFTHELCRHRPGVAISQESMRYVRLDELGFWFPEWAQGDPELMARCMSLLLEMERHQQWMSAHFGLDEKGAKFSDKKHMTSFMRRFAPDGVATGVLWTCNWRGLRHVIEARTDPGAEEEIRLVFGKVARIMVDEAPALFGDFTEKDDGSWVPEHSKV